MDIVDSVDGAAAGGAAGVVGMTWTERIGEQIGVLGGVLTVVAAVAGWLLRAFALGRRFERMEDRAGAAIDLVTKHEERLQALETGAAVKAETDPVVRDSREDAMKACQQVQDQRASTFTAAVAGLSTEIRDMRRQLVDIALHLGVARGKAGS